MSDSKYVHGYSERESVRLGDQANTLSGLLHHDTRYPAGSRVLELGCGVGSQTVHLARNSPDAHFVSVDISPESLAAAQERVRAEGHSNVEFRQADIFHLDFPPDSFDHVFICFVLEHLPHPAKALEAARVVLKPGGTLTAIEGDHGSFYCYPETEEARAAVDCLIRVQADLGGDSLIGRRLYPLVTSAGFREVSVSPRMVYVDSSRPEWVEGFSKNTFTAMVEGVREASLAKSLISEARWEKGIRDLYRATEEDGVFCYTFFKAVGLK
ncbi:MAG TPA: methyltransferase domain-containing protein [Candidatus Hydrogenedentes bacterium]|nr:methyltransferase domain-containing protein [Candidatus Hydrogenedentota bacterium]HPG69675.1 methyltransferase domain-containing protein [Candidatus Hydrogenedentota bacterium]